MILEMTVIIVVEMIVGIFVGYQFGKGSCK